MKHILFLLCITLFALSCNEEKKGVPNVSKDPVVKLESYRFDRDIAQIDTANIPAGLTQLQAKYPFFLNFWLDELMQFGVKGNFSETNPAVSGDLRTFLTYKDFRGLFDTVAAHFPDTRQLEESLGKGFRYYRHYYPSAGSEDRVLRFRPEQLECDHGRFQYPRHRA